MPATILVCDDDSAIRTVLNQALGRAGYDVRTTGTAAGLWRWISAGDGNLVITGRSKDVIVLANGKNVYPEELEAHYSQSIWIKELCVMGIQSPEGERLHAVIVPEMEEFRRRAQTTINENIQIDIENLSKELPSYYRILSFSIRNEPFPRTVTRKLQRFEIQREEETRKTTSVHREALKEHPRFSEGAGVVIAQLVRQAKPDAGPLDVSMNLELDLGFDSLARVELQIGRAHV